MALDINLNVTVNLFVHHLPCPPRGVTGFKIRQKKGTHAMPADVLGSWTADIDPNVVTTTTSFSVNGVLVGSITQPASTTSVAYSQLSPPGPVLAVGDVVSATNTDTDNIGQTSPPISGGSVTIAVVQPPPTGVTDFTLKQSGTP